MIETNTSLYDKAYNPFLQGGCVLAINIVIMLLAKIINSSGVTSVSPGFYWQIIGTAMLCYAVFNSIFSLSTNNINQYWLQSIFSFGVMVGVSALVAHFLSGQSITEAGPYKAIFTVLTFGYLVFLSIMNFMKNIVNYAEQEDWQAPKKRKK